MAVMVGRRCVDFFIGSEGGLREGCAARRRALGAALLARSVALIILAINWSMSPFFGGIISDFSAYIIFY
ncbi:hypothetical protein ACLFKT_36515 [Paraburkholderia sp. BR14261]